VLVVLVAHCAGAGAELPLQVGFSGPMVVPGEHTANPYALGRLAAQSSITTHDISAFSDILPPSGQASRFFCVHVA
jgi:hypothetical protein